ncbi:MAG: MFS transporter [Defluviitaleaceae bacterium]|nr:MFS transporter [Defluviitaleaceae bacterium]
METERKRKFFKSLTKEELSWILSDWASQSYVMIVMTVIFSLFFMQAAYYAGITSEDASAFYALSNTVATIIIGVMAPVIGAISGFKGRKKAMFTFFTFIGMLGTIGLAFIPEQLWFWILVVFVISSIGYSGQNKIYDAFLVDVTDNKRMNWISSLGFGFGYIGGALPFILSMVPIVLVEFGVLNMSLMTAYRISFGVAVVWWVIFILPFMRNVHQKYGVEKEKGYIKKSFVNVWETFKEITKQKSILIFLVAFFLYSDGVGSIIRMAIAYGTTIGLDAMTLLMVLLVTQFVAFPFAILYGRLSVKFGAKFMIYVAIITYVIICIIALFMNPERDIETLTVMFWSLAMLVGTAQGGIQALSRSYFGRIIPKDKSNEYFGFYNVFSRFASILGTTIFGVITLLTGQPHFGIAGIALLFIASAIIFKFVPSDKPGSGFGE